jgi:hypothetical protein
MFLNTSIDMLIVPAANKWVNAWASVVVSLAYVDW